MSRRDAAELSQRRVLDHAAAVTRQQMTRPRLLRSEKDAAAWLSAALGELHPDDAKMVLDVAHGLVEALRGRAAK